MTDNGIGVRCRGRRREEEEFAVMRPSSRSSASVPARCCVVLRRWDHLQDCQRIESGLARASGPFDDTTRQIQAVQQLGKGAATRLAPCFNGRRGGRAHLRE